MSNRKEDMSLEKETTFIFMRHGQADHNIKSAAGEVVDERVDYPLNEVGVGQVKEARAKLPSVDLIVTSPMKRAMMTAEIVNEVQNVPLVVEPNLSERLAGGVDAEAWHELFDIDKNVQPKGEEAENVRSFFERVYAAIDDLQERYAGKTVLIVSHGGVRNAFHAYFNDLPWQGNMRIGGIGNAETIMYKVAGKKEKK